MYMIYSGVVAGKQSFPSSYNFYYSRRSLRTIDKNQLPKSLFPSLLLADSVTKGLKLKALPKCEKACQFHLGRLLLAVF